MTTAERTRRKVTARILPFFLLLYIVSYIDRANVSFAKLTMSADLHFSEAVFGFGAGIFFVGYFLLEIPGTPDRGALECKALDLPDSGYLGYLYSFRWVRPLHEPVLLDPLLPRPR